jgi:hypothetical protein
VVFDLVRSGSSGSLFACRTSACPTLRPTRLPAGGIAARIFAFAHADSNWARFGLGLVAKTELTDRVAVRIGVQSWPVRRVIDAIRLPSAAAGDGGAAEAAKAAGQRLLYLSKSPRGTSVV